MRARSFFASLPVIASLLVSQIGAAPPAAAATLLPFDGSVFDMVVDGAHDHVFVSSGPGGNDVAVLDYSGVVVQNLIVPGASGMTLVGGTLFVASAGSDEIVTVDTTASPLTLGDHFPTAPLTDPGSLASVAGELWFTTGDCGTTVQHAHMDTDGTNVSAAVTLDANVCPRYAASPTDPNLLLMFDEGESPMTLYEYDMSTASPTLVRSAENPDGSSSGQDAVFAPAGASFMTAAGSASAFGQVKTSDLSLIRSYTADASPGAVDTTAAGGGQLVGGSDTPGGDSVRVYPIGNATATNTFDLPGDDAVVPRGVAWADDGSAIIVIAHGSGSGALRSYALDPAAVGSTTTLNAAPNTVKVGDRITLSGTLTAGDTSSVEGEGVTITRTDVTGTDTVGTATVAADGTYIAHDKAHVGGQATYLARFDGSFHLKPSQATDTVAVEKLASHVSIRVSDKAVTFGRSVRVTGHLGSGTQSRVLELFAQPDGGNKTRLRKANVDKHGNLSVSYSPGRDTTFSARFGGDLKHRGDQDHAVTRVRVIVHAKLLRSSSTSGKYKIYPRGSRAPILVHVAPNHRGYSVTGTLQAYTGGRWVTLATNSTALNSKSEAGFYAKGSSNVNFRAQIRMRTHKDHLGDVSPWLYLRFS
jgi:hypothetical protein